MAEAYTIRAELPGLSKEKVKVTLDNGALTLSGERDLERRVETKTFHRVERSHGTFTRSFTLPDDVDPESVADRIQWRLDRISGSIAKKSKTRTA